MMVIPKYKQSIEVKHEIHECFRQKIYALIEIDQNMTAKEIFLAIRNMFDINCKREGNWKSGSIEFNPFGRKKTILYHREKNPYLEKKEGEEKEKSPIQELLTEYVYSLEMEYSEENAKLLSAIVDHFRYGIIVKPDGIYAIMSEKRLTDVVNRSQEKLKQTKSSV